MSKWYEKTGTIYWYDQYALNDAETAFSKYDPQRIIKELLYVNADINVIYATNQFNIAYYPSKFIPEHPNLKNHDYVGEIVPQLRKKGKKVVLYVNWLDSKHPEWNLVSLQEDDTIVKPIDYPFVSWANLSKEEWKVRKIPGGKWQTPCMNSPKKELMKNIVKELVENYEFDGFHLDMFFHTCVCVCNYCKPFIKKIIGKEEIKWSDLRKNWYEYINWRFEVSSNYIKEITTILKSHNKDLIAMHNAFSPLAMSAVSGLNEGWLPYLDVYVSECFDVFESPYADINSVSLQVKFHKAIKKPSLILLTSTPLDFGHSPISKSKFLMYVSSAKVNGCQIFGPCGVGAHQDTTTDKRLLSITKDIFSFWKKDSEEFNNLESLAKVGVIFSFSTRAYYEPGINPAKYIAEFNGWCKILIEKHIPFNIEIAEFLDDDTAGKYEVLILPNVACTDSKFEKVIDNFVSRGGKIIATAETSLYDNKGKIKKDFGLSNVFGVDFIKQYESKYFYVEDKIEPIICGGNAQCMKANKAKVLARLITADPSGSPSGNIDPLPLDVTEFPLYTKNKYNRGEAYYIAWDAGKFNMDYGYWQTTEWMNRVFNDVIKKPIFTTNAPSTVEIMLWKEKNKNRLIFKLANKTVPQIIPTRHSKRDIDEIIPLNNIELKLNVKSNKIKIISKETDIKLIKERNRYKIIIKKLNVYASIIVKGYK